MCQRLAIPDFTPNVGTAGSCVEQIGQLLHHIGFESSFAPHGLEMLLEPSFVDHEIVIVPSRINCIVLEQIAMRKEVGDLIDEASTHLNHGSSFYHHLSIIDLRGLIS